MEKKALLGLVVILLALSHVVSVPATRSLVAKQADPLSSDQDRHAKEAMDFKTSTFEMEKEAGSEGRMMMDVVDYNGPRANPAHNKSPGKPGF